MTVRHVKAFAAETLGDLERKIEKFLSDCWKSYEKVITDLKYTVEEDSCHAMIIYEIRQVETYDVARTKPKI